MKLIFREIAGWVHSQYILAFCGISKPREFYGYNHFVLAIVYAEKRKKLWKRKWDQLGREQGVFAYSDDSLIVCSTAELKMIDKLVNPLHCSHKHRKVFKRQSYYNTKQDEQSKRTIRGKA